MAAVPRYDVEVKRLGRWLRIALIGTLTLGITQVAAEESTLVLPGDLLPDLVQEPPQNIGVTRVGTRDLLGFRSAVHNAGDGPLIITARRSGTGVRDMAARQTIRRADGTIRTIGGVGHLRYVRSPDHAHWHLMPFERYELRTEDRTAAVVRDQKTGFCLGDRYRAEPRPVGTVAVPVYVGLCGKGVPTRLAVTEGISVGWGDDYPAYLDGQHIDVTGLPMGRYVLVHTVNLRGLIVERDRTNNTSSRRIELRRVAGRVRVRVLAPLP